MCQGLLIIDMMCQLGTPALDQRVMAFALMLWFVYMVESPATSLILFIMLAMVLTPKGLCSNHTLSSGLTFDFGCWKNALHFGLIFSR